MTVIITQQILRHQRALIRTAEGGGKGDIDRPVPLGVGTFKQIHQHLGRCLGGLGEFLRATEKLIETVLIQIYVLLILLLAEAHHQRDAGHIQVLQFPGLKICCGIGNNLNHNYPSCHS